MKKTLKPETTKPQYVVTTDITYAQVDSWFGHCRRDLKLDLIYPEDGEGKTYPCIVWICGGAWQRMDKAAHLAYLGTLAQEGFVVVLHVWQHWIRIKNWIQVSIWSIPVRFRRPVRGIRRPMRPIFHMMMWKRQPCLQSRC